MSLRPYRALFALLCICTLALTLTSTAAHAAGTGDNPARTVDALDAKQAARKSRLEAETRALADSLLAKGGTAPAIIEAPYAFLYTPSHKQEKSYWCGPATCQVIDHYLGSYVSQSKYADFMGTTTEGTDFSLLDDCLRANTSRPYYYYGSLTESNFCGRVSDTLKYHAMPLAADLKIVASLWPNYNYDHDGHIVPIEGFDWRVDTVRLNDVFNEADYYWDGGSTYGRRTYDRVLVWSAVYSHFRRAVVSAP